MRCDIRRWFWLAALVLLGFLGIPEARGGLITLNARATAAAASSTDRDEDSSHQEPVATRPVQIGPNEAGAQASAQITDESKWVRGYTDVIALEKGFATGSYDARIEVVVTPNSSLGQPGDLIEVTSSINIHGEVVANSTDGGIAFSTALFILFQDENVLVRSFRGGKDGVYSESGPVGLVPFTYRASIGSQFTFELSLLGTAQAFVPGPHGGPAPGSRTANARSNYGNTITWGGVERAILVSTGEELTDFTLLDEDGQNWALPPRSAAAVPEPSSLLIAMTLLGGFGLTVARRRRQRLQAA